MPLTNAAPIVFRPEDAAAKKSGRPVVISFASGKKRYAWAFFPSGLQVLAPLKKLPIIDVNIVIRGGAEHDKTPGTAHALEHLVCKDVLAEGPHPTLRGLTRVGLDWNAFTSWETTTYWARSSFQHWRALLDGMLALAFASTTIDEARWKKERPAILHEIHGRSEEKRVHDAILAARHPKVKRYQAPIVGRDTDVQALTADDLRHAYETSHHPENALIVVHGLATADELVEHLLVSGTLNAPRPSVPRILKLPSDDAGVKTDLTVRVRGGTSVERLAMYSDPFPFDEATQAIWQASEALVGIFNDGGLLQEELRRSRELVYSAHASGFFLHPGELAFGVFGRTREKHMDEGSAVIRSLWGRVCRDLRHRRAWLKPFVDTYRGGHRLERNTAKMNRFEYEADRMVRHWLYQCKRDPITDVHELTTSAIPGLFPLVEGFADLPWQVVRVLPA